ncbi:hypothetical protein BCR42DRAFT_451358 [Absidia repens]|uniref:Tho complex subunit 7-domain-containing protein n=1 Tax=Absidia repens TaxID=90262 RepID=A0A1X2IHA2_9FUNG|nr:hypothetical protein BCR42DRAFT_451358 [Absidia repens]
MNADDDWVLKARLAMDERPIRNLEKRINQWMRSLSTDSLETTQNNYESILTQIANYQTNIERHNLIQRANKKDVERYSERVDKTSTMVVETREAITSLKDDLVKAQKIRDNKLEYDKVALEIMKLQTRDAYQESIQQLKSDIEFLKNEKAKKETTVMSRKRQLGDLIDSAKKIQKGMEEQRAQTRETQKRVMDMGQEYDSSDDENDEDMSHGASPDETSTLPNGTAAATSHRFQERNEDEDEEGMVPNGDDEEKTNIVTNSS